MSEEGAPNLLNLRGFRIQKKPSFTHTPVNGSLNTSSDCSPDIRVYGTKRRVIPISESDSDCEMNKSNDKVLESHVTTATTSRPSINTTSTSNAFTESFSYTLTPFVRCKKTEKVLEREKQMKYLKEKYPSCQSMAIHNALSKHNFDLSKAVVELDLELEQQNKKASKVGVEDFTDWKNNLQVAESNSSSLSYNHTAHKKRPNSGEFSQSIKHKAKRMKTDAVSDESDYENNDYRDKRVYDSDEDSDVEISNILTGDKRKVLEFFQTAIPTELLLMNSCSKKKADMIIEFRPFDDWVDLVQKLQSNRSLGTELLNAAQEVLITRSNIQNLMKKCKNLASQMERAVAAGAGVKEQPALLDPTKKLTSYQMVGLNWLAVLHAQGVNGILADEMGLGKTIQVIAFLAHLKEIGATKGIPHLIVVPSSTLDNWRVEFEKWCPSIKILMYYGNMEERKMCRIEYWSKNKLSEYDVILTTYTMVSNTPEERKMFKVTQMHYVVFDEAHMLKNMNTQRYEHLIRIKAMNRILLTGTPLQNNLLELMSLLIFVMPAMFAGKSDDLKSLFQKNSKASKQGEEQDLPAFEKNQIKHAKDIMKPFVLRRLKRDVLQDLPKKTDELVKVPLPPTQLEQYQNLVFHFQNYGKENPNENTYNAMTIMSDLRKLSNHPLLLRYFYQHEDLKEMAKLLAKDPGYKEKVVEYVTDDLSFMSDFEIHQLCKDYKCLSNYVLPGNLILTSGKFLYLDKKLAELKENGRRVLIFSQYVIMLNIMEDYLQLRNHTYLRLDGSTPVTTRQELIDQYSADPDIFIFLLSTRAGGLGINLTAADTVIIHDIDFNPYNDKQAEDRCHRMGQTKPVHVIRLISQNTLEEGMWQMNQEKLKLEKEVTAEESENPDVKSVVRLLSSVLGVDNTKLNSMIPTSKKKL